MPTTYSSFEELGKKVKEDNPRVTLPDREAGLKFAQKFPNMATVKEVEDQVDIKEEPWGQSLVQGVQAVDNALRSLTTEMPVAKQFNEFSQGFASGLSAGATKELAKRWDNPQNESLFHTAGEIVGEIAGPMNLIHKAWGTAKAASMLGKAAVAGGEGVTTEGIKGAVNYALRPSYEKEDLGAQALIGGGAALGMDLGLRGTGKAVGTVASKILGVAPTQINNDYVQFMRKHGQKVIPTMAAPESQGARRVLRWMRESAGSANKLRGAAQELMQYTTDQKNRFVAHLGGEQITSSKAGRALVQSFKETHDALKSDAAEIYRDMIRANPKIGKMPIQANADVMVPMNDGSIKRINMLETLDDAVKELRPEDPNELKKLKKQVDRLLGRAKEAKNPQAVTMKKELRPLRSKTLQKDISEQQYTPEGGFVRKRYKASASGEEGDLTPEVRSRLRLDPTAKIGNTTLYTPTDVPYGTSADIGGAPYSTRYGQTQGGSRSAMQDPTNPAVPAGQVSQEALEAAGAKVRQRYEEVEVPQYMTYEQWWEELQTIGNLIGEAKGRNMPGVAGKLGRVYGDLQDALDWTAEQTQPGWSEPIRLARQKYRMYKTFADNPIVDRIAKLGNMKLRGGKETIEKFSNIAGEMFKDVDVIRQAKQIIPPEQFAMLRSAHIQDLIWKARATGDIKEGNVIERLDFDKLINAIEHPGNTKRGGLNGEYWEELFSDEGFTDVFGQPVQYNGGGAELGEQMKELVRLAAVTDIQAGSLAPGSEGFTSAMAENFAPGVIVKDPVANFNMLEGLLANILTTKKFARDFFEQDIDKNIYLQGKFKGELPDFLTAKDDLVQRGMRSTLTNMLTGAAGVR